MKREALLEPQDLEQETALRALKANVKPTKQLARWTKIDMMRKYYGQTRKGNQRTIVSLYTDLGEMEWWIDNKWEKSDLPSFMVDGLEQLKTYPNHDLYYALDIIDSLETIDAQCLKLKIQGLSHREIAEIFGWHESRVSQRIKRITGKLKEWV